MDIKGRVWQVGTGSNQRSYGDLFLKYDLMAIGPGDEGLFNEKNYSKYGDIKNSIRRFYHSAKKGDIVVARLGTAKIIAVGVIADDHPMILEEFADVDDYHIQHTRRVRWFPNAGTRFLPRTLGAQVRTFASVNNFQVLRWIRQLKVSSKQLERKLKALPKTSISLTDEEVKRQLIAQGFSKERAKMVVSALKSIRKIGEWYGKREKLGEWPSEQETITHIVIPFLRALDWTHKETTIEWRNIDIALFRRITRKDSFLSCIIETKAKGSSVFEHLNQVSKYARAKGREHCGSLIITDGLRYACFRKQSTGFKLKAYLNILRMRQKYPLYECAGAVEAIKGMVK
ncbi:MAG: hypothetical protein WCY09_01805 [Candidatus Omnitrophota bacterium]